MLAWTALPWRDAHRAGSKLDDLCWWARVESRQQPLLCGKLVWRGPRTNRSRGDSGRSVGTAGILASVTMRWLRPERNSHDVPARDVFGLSAVDNRMAEVSRGAEPLPELQNASGNWKRKSKKTKARKSCYKLISANLCRSGNPNRPLSGGEPQPSVVNEVVNLSRVSSE